MSKDGECTSYHLHAIESTPGSDDLGIYWKFVDLWALYINWAAVFIEKEMKLDLLAETVPLPSCKLRLC